MTFKLFYFIEKLIIGTCSDSTSDATNKKCLQSATIADCLQCDGGITHCQKCNYTSDHKYLSKNLNNCFANCTSDLGK